jgi:putative phosphoesterase
LKKILIISDTHSHIDNTILKYVKETDEVWHAGDIGNIKILTEIEKFSKIKSVYGNIDDHVIRSFSPETNSFFCEKIKISMIHIAGKPPYYNPKTKKLISKEKPRILIYGHSHILKVNHDKKNNLLCINPGAAGRHGFHKKRTMIRFEIDGINIKNMEVIELGNRSKSSNSI